MIQASSRSYISNLLFFFLILGLGMLIGNLTTLLFAHLKGITVDTIIMDQNLFFETFSSNELLLFLAINQTLVFIIPAFIYFKYLSKTDILQAKKNSVAGLFIIPWIWMLSLPLIQFMQVFNSHLPLAEWMHSTEDQLSSMLEKILNTQSFLSFLLSMITIAVIPAIGEELVFRGIIQSAIKRWTKHPITSIIVSAIIFSGFHMQFEGFFGRLFLGIVLAILFEWSGSLIPSILFHFLNNAVQLILHKLSPDRFSASDVEQTSYFPFWIYAVSCSLLLLSLYYYKQQCNKKDIVT